MRKLMYCICLIIGMWLGPAFAAPPALLLTDAINELESTALIPHIGFIEDVGGKLSITDLLSNEKVFSEQTEHFINVGLGQSHRWLRFTVENQTQDKLWYLEVGGSITSQVEVFTKGNKTHIKQEAMQGAIAHRYRLIFEPNQATTIYIQMYDPKGVAKLSPTLFSASQMIDSVSYRHAFYAFLMSGFFILAAYNVLCFFYLKDISFLTLAMSIIGFALAMGNTAGLLHFFPWLASSLKWNNATFLFIVLISGLPLATSLLDLRSQLPKLVAWFHLGSLVAFISMVSTLIYGHGLRVAGILAVLAIVLILVTLIKLFKQGYIPPKTLVVGILIFFAAGLPLILMAIGVIEHHPQMNDNFFISTLIALLLMSLTQAERVRLKRESLERTAASNDAKDEFLTTMSHELRTPMNAVVGAGQLLKLTSLSEEQTEFVSRLNHSSGHMLSLVNDLLDLTRVDHHLLQLERVPFRLEESLNTLKQLLQEAAAKKHLDLSLENRFLPLNKQLIGDPTRLNQVLLNLMGNAIKFTHRGEVSLSITPISINPNQVRLYFEVNDTGIGLREDQQERLFQPFMQAESSTSRRFGGSGLGLAISHKLVKRMGGDLKVSSVHKQGSSFSFTLNFPLEVNDSKPEKEVPILSGSLHGFKVLLVDDDEMNRFFGKKLLEACDVDVMVADSGEAAIELMQQQAFDLVFMDVSMPNVDGYEATRRLRMLPANNKVIVVALTAHAVAGERERCLEAGMNDYLTKPFELDDLRNMMVKWLANKLSTNIQSS